MSDLSEENPSKSDVEQTSSSSIGGENLNPSTSIRLFGQFKSNDFNLNSSPSSTSNASFTQTLAKICKSSFGNGFTSPSTPLATSLAPLGANKPLFGGSTTTTPSSFTDLKRKLSNDSPRKSDGEDDEADETEEEEEGKVSLLESVKEYEAKHPSTVVSIQGDTSTGEEDEMTKFQITGKLYLYQSDQQQFIERGFGTLKINEKLESDQLQGRLIMRLDKSFRVILNSPLFSTMTIERVTDRSVRFGAQDEGQLRVFLLKASTNDCHRFIDEIQSRLEILLRQQTSPTRQGKRSHSESSDDSPKKSKLIDSTADEKKDEEGE